MAFTCPRCSRTSHNPADEREGYCGACRAWTGSPPPVMQVIVPGPMQAPLREWLASRGLQLFPIPVEHDPLPTFGIARVDLTRFPRGGEDPS